MDGGTGLQIITLFMSQCLMNLRGILTSRLTLGGWNKNKYALNLVKDTYGAVETFDISKVGTAVTVLQYH